MNSQNPLPYRIGYGEDAHKLASGHPLVLGAIEIPHAEKGAIAHSDGDALLHAVADALLSGLALGDIGQYFPDTAAEWKDMKSSIIIEKALELVRKRGYAPVNVALVVTLDKPKLGPLRAEIAQSVAKLLGLPDSEVGVSFKTSEGLALEHVQCRVTVLLGHISE